MNKIIVALSMAALSCSFIAKAMDPGQIRLRGISSHMSPPKIAIEACQGIDEGNECTITVHESTEIKGTCRAVPSGEFTCVPNRHKRTGGYGGNLGLDNEEIMKHMKKDD